MSQPGPWQVVVLVLLCLRNSSACSRMVAPVQVHPKQRPVVQRCRSALQCSEGMLLVPLQKAFVASLSCTKGQRSGAIIVQNAGYQQLPPDQLGFAFPAVLAIRPSLMLICKFLLLALYILSSPLIAKPLSQPTTSQTCTPTWSRSTHCKSCCALITCSPWNNAKAFSAFTSLTAYKRQYCFANNWVGGWSCIVTFLHWTIPLCVCPPGTDKVQLVQSFRYRAEIITYAPSGKRDSCIL